MPESLRLAAAVACTLALNVAHAAVPAPLCLRAPSDAPVTLHGMPNFDKAGGGAQTMLYPMPGLAGAMAALATHAAVNGAMRSSENERVRVQADAMLLPYQAPLSGYKHHELIQAALAQLSMGGARRYAPAGAAPAPGETLVDSTPAFFMTPDQRALVMENAIAVLPHGAASPYQQVIRVVSPVQAAGTTAATWFDNHAALLRRVSARMLAQSVDIALADMPDPGAGAQAFRTVRYPEGGVERMERAQVVREHCGLLVLRTLRGNLMAVPGAQGADGPACAKADL
jgi:hypothetical protein